MTSCEKSGFLKTETADRDSHRIEYLPGSAVRCLDDGELTFLEFNQGFLDMLGYTPQTLKDCFANCFAALIHPDDRAMALKKLREPAEAEFRLACAENTKWVLAQVRRLNQGAGSELLCLLLDITRHRSNVEELRSGMERFRAIIDSTSDIVFEWNIERDTITYSENWESKFGYPPLSDNVTASVPKSVHLHPEDAPKLAALIETIREGAPYAVAECRILGPGGRFLWCRIRAACQFNEQGTASRAVGIITDISEERHVIDVLRHRAERDALTGLYNKMEFQALVEAYLVSKPEDELCAMLMVDIDNFKEVNDTKGHLYGDALLSELAAQMKRDVRSGDIIGRIGGDEFAVFLKGLPSADIPARKAARLLKSFHNLPVAIGCGLHITSSIGIALSPDHAADFHRLYQCADTALYQAKSEGKDRAAVFSPGDALGQYVGKSSIGAEIDSNQQIAGAPYDLITYVFDILYSTRELDEAVSLILKIVGKRFDVSRAYIFENSPDNLFSSNTFEWCNTGVTSQKAYLQNLPYDSLGNYEHLFDENGILYCHDVNSCNMDCTELLRKQGIRSLLHCIIRENGRPRGFVGFDECSGTRLWTREEIAALTLISKLLSTFLLKKRAQDRDRETSRRLIQILDRLSVYIYAVEQENYKLLYLNAKARELDPCAKLGGYCYREFFGRDIPCEACPVRETSLTGKPCAMELDNPRYGITFRAHAEEMDWNSRPACLVSSYTVRLLPESTK